MLQLHRSERADALVEALAGVLAAPLDDPMQPEVVSVPTRGVERWLTQRLSHRLGVSQGREDGVCANVDFPFPGRLVGDALAAATGVDRDADPWRPERAVWPLVDVLEANLDQTWLSAVKAHLESVGGDELRRFGTARQVADLFDHYAIHRPWMVRSWLAGDDVDAAGVALADHHSWQPKLWRLLRERIGVPGPAELLADACARLAEEPTIADEFLPERFALFGLTRLPASYLDVLPALASHRDVHLFLLHPSHSLWERLTPQAGTRLRRADDFTASEPRNPLLRSWGRDAREMQLVLAGADADQHHPVATSEPRTLLERIQHGVRADEWPPAERATLDPTDKSVQVHACHGRARQVEVLRDAVLHLLADDPSLEPRDVIVMCPDIEEFAPLIHATFGAGDAAHDDDDEDTRPAAVMPDLRVRLADRALRQTNPVLGAVSDLLEIAAGRVTAPQVLDFAGREPVRRRFRVDDDDIATLKEWVSRTGIRWGLDSDHRARWSLQDVEANTWRTGLDRVLVGVAMAEEDERLVGDVLPLDDVDSGAIDLAGRFAELVGRLHRAVTELQGPHTAARWAEHIGEGADALTATAERDAWQRAQLQGLLDDLRDQAQQAPATTLQLAELRALLADRLKGQPTRANFRTGHLTICTLVPMRSVPHRVVCLLGLDDGAFPRQGNADGDDLIAADPYVGDRDARSEDRQLLLDALLAAQQTLVITYAGRDERTNAPRPPAVPVGELLDVIERTVDIDAKDFVRHHPLQPFDPRNFDARDPFSFDPVNLDGAKAVSSPRTDRRPFLSGPLKKPHADGTEVVELDALVKFVQHPVKAFLRQRLNVSLGDWSEDIDEAIPVELDPLEKWEIGDRIVERLLAGADIDACMAAERARGDLPPGRLGDPAIEDICAIAQGIADAARDIAPGVPESTEVRVRFDDGRLLSGTVGGLVEGNILRSASYSKLAAKHRVTAWVRLLVLVAARPDQQYAAVTIGRPENKRKSVRVARITGVQAHTATKVLHDLVALYDLGMTEPLPIYCKTSAAFAEGRNPENDWTTRDRGFNNEDSHPEHRLVLGGQRPLAEVLADDRFGFYAHRLWDPLLAVEKVDEQ
jgi:exodeoxyribonuclease V gamma subunit